MFELLSPSEVWRSEIHVKSYYFMSELQRDSLTLLCIGCVKQLFITTTRAGVFFPFPLFMLCLNKALKASLIILKWSCPPLQEKNYICFISFILNSISLPCSSYDLSTVKCNTGLLCIFPHLSWSTAVSELFILYWFLLWSIVFPIWFHWISFLFHTIFLKLNQLEIVSLLSNVLVSSLISSSEMFCFRFLMQSSTSDLVIFIPCIFSSTIFLYFMRMSQITFSKSHTIQDTSLGSHYSHNLLSSIRKGNRRFISLQCSDIFQCWRLQMVGVFAKDSMICNMPLETLAAVLLRKFHDIAL